MKSKISPLEKLKKEESTVTTVPEKNDAAAAPLAYVSNVKVTDPGESFIINGKEVSSGVLIAAPTAIESGVVDEDNENKVEQGTATLPLFSPSLFNQAVSSAAGNNGFTTIFMPVNSVLPSTAQLTAAFIRSQNQQQQQPDLCSLQPLSNSQ